MSDKLDAIFNMQHTLNKMCGVDTSVEMSPEDKQKWILNYCRAMTQELAELTDSCAWKWWAKYQKFDEQNARVEVIDLLHFIVSSAQVLGLTAEDLFEIYSKKFKVNIERQQSGYTNKNTEDCKHI